MSTSTTAASQRTPLPRRGRAWLLGVMVPALIMAAALILAREWRSDLPEQIVTHWGPGGATTVGSPDGTLVFFAVYGALSLLVTAAFALGTGRTSVVRGLTYGIGVGMAIFWAGLLLSMLAAQRGLPPERIAEASSPDLPLTITVLLAVAGGLVTGMLGGADPHRPATGPVEGEQARIAVGAEPTWERRVGPGPQGMRRAWAAAVLYSVASLAFAWWAQMWFLAVVLVLVVPVALMFLVWHVRVDAGGLTIRGGLGWPIIRLRADEVVGTTVRERVSPFADFGGWGLRVCPSGDGTLGVVVRTGEALVVERTGERRFLVTVDDAAEGAALLNAYAARAREVR